MKTKSSMKKPSGHVPAGGAFSSKKKEVVSKPAHLLPRRCHLAQSTNWATT